MATQICPNCEKDSFTWILDDEKTNLTIWHCYNCKYEAEEKENSKFKGEIAHMKWKDLTIFGYCLL